MSASSHTLHAEDRTARIATDRRRRRMSRGAGALLAAALLLALPVSIGAQTRVLVTSTIAVTVHEEQNPTLLPCTTVTVSALPPPPHCLHLHGEAEHCSHRTRDRESGE